MGLCAFQGIFSVPGHVPAAEDTGKRITAGVIRIKECHYQGGRSAGTTRENG